MRDVEVAPVIIVVIMTILFLGCFGKAIFSCEKMLKRGSNVIPIENVTIVIPEMVEVKVIQDTEEKVTLEATIIQEVA